MFQKLYEKHDEYILMIMIIVKITYVQLYLTSCFFDPIQRSFYSKISRSSFPTESIITRSQ
jgi:hypothetical protein